MRDDLEALARPIGALLPLVVASVLVPARGHMQNTNVALILMITVVIAAAVGGRPGGVMAAITAALSFNFFHTKPYLSLTIDSGDDIETMALLLVAGLVVGTVAGRRQALQGKVEQGREEVRRLHRVADLIAHDAQPAEILFACERELTALLHLSSCEFEAGPHTSGLVRLERNGAIGTRLFRFAANGEFELPREGVDLPVLYRGHRIGSFLLSPTPGIGVSFDERIVAVAIADQAGAALGPSTPVEERWP